MALESLAYLKVIASGCLDFISGHAPQVISQWTAVLHMAYPEFQAVSLKEIVHKLIERTMYNREAHTQSMLDFVEFFAGNAALSKELLRKQLRGASFDYLYGSSHDVLTASGLRLYIEALGSLREKGLSWLATQCSSYVVLCRATTMRFPSNDFLGNLSNPRVVEGNSLGLLSALLYFLAWVSLSCPVLEQPLNSCLPETPAWKYLLRWTKAICTTTYLGSFGGPSQKPLQLWHSRMEFVALSRPRPTWLGAAAESLVTRDGAKFTGRRDQLIESEHYTVQFGRAVADIVCDL